MTEPVPVAGLVSPVFQPVPLTTGGLGLGPVPDLVSPFSNTFTPSAPPSPSDIGYSCQLPPPFRPLAADQAQRLVPYGIEEALSTIEGLYRREPSEVHVMAFLSVLERGGIDLRDLRDRLTADCFQIATQGASWALFPSETRRDVRTAGLFDTLNASFAREQADAAAFDASLYQPVERLLSDRLFRMIREGSSDPARALLNEAFARHLLGEDEAAEIPLRRALDELDRRPAPPSRETLTERITVLHRLATLSIHYFEEQGLWVARAAEDVERLASLAPGEAALLRAENLNLRLRIEPRAIEAEAASGVLDKDDAPYVYAARVGELYREVIKADRAALEVLSDPADRDFLERYLAGASAGLVEHNYGVALNFHLRDEDDDGRPYAAAGDANLQALEDLRSVLSPAAFGELRARSLLARSYYHFRMGRMEDSAQGPGALSDIETILSDYPDTLAARSVRAPGNWPEKYGIVDGAGRLSPDLHDPSVTAALLTAASLLTENESRALLGCGVGAVIGAGASLFFGEKVTGAAILSSCVAGTLAERAVYVLQNIDRIGESYRAGVSNVTAGDALKSLGEFTLTLLSFYGGARLGAFLERTALAGGSVLGRSAASILTRMGFEPGPWTRRIAAFALRESGRAMNALGFQGTMVAAQSALHPSAGVSLNAENFFGGWLFVRFLPTFVALNPVGSLLKGVPFEPTALRTLNGALGVAGLEGFRELATGEDLNHYGDRVAGGIFLSLPFLAGNGGNAASPKGPGGPGRPDYVNLKPGAVVRLPIADIVPTQGKVFSAQVEAYRSGRLPGDLPEIRVIDNVPYVVDGHHRLYAAWSRGETFVEVRNYDPAMDPYSDLIPTLSEKATHWGSMMVEPSRRVYGRPANDPRLN